MAGYFHKLVVLLHMVLNLIRVNCWSIFGGPGALLGGCRLPSTAKRFRCSKMKQAPRREEEYE